MGDELDFEARVDDDSSDLDECFSSSCLWGKLEEEAEADSEDEDDSTAALSSILPDSSGR